MRNAGRNSRVVDMAQQKPIKNENMEKEEEECEANIEVKNMSKKWGSGKAAKLAVNDLNFRACKGKVFNSGIDINIFLG
jgi:predicted metal-dependent hydrolase